MERSEDELYRLKDLDPLRRRPRPETSESTQEPAAPLNAHDERARIVAEMRRQTGDDADFTKKWAPDELDFPKVNATERLECVRKLYAERIQRVALRRSIYQSRPLVYFFKYPPVVIDLYNQIGKTVQFVSDKSNTAACQYGVEDLERVGEDKVGIHLVNPDKNDIIRFTPNAFLGTFSAPFAKIARVYSTMKELMKHNGFILTHSQKYNICWGFSKHRAQLKYLTMGQRFSHFQGCWQMGRKDFLWQNVQRKRLRFPQFLDFMPLTYCLKNDYEQFLANKHVSDYWIIKPVDAARGEGIYVARSTDEIKQSKGSRQLNQTDWPASTSPVRT